MNAHPRPGEPPDVPGDHRLAFPKLIAGFEAEAVDYKTLGSAGNGTVRGPGLYQYDLSVQKNFRLSEKLNLEFRTEFFNLTNTPQFSTPNRNVFATNFGEITGAQGERDIQFGLKLVF